jgi:serine protease Do
VTLADKRKFTAKLVGTDPSTDVALLKIESDRALPTVDFGNDRALRVGDWVIAVGNPFGLSNSVTAGIVSSLGRDVGSASNYNDFIQIDAPINQGNSGGPTFDLRGQVVGMNSMIYSPSGGSVGIGFAIPAGTIHDVVAQLKEHGHVNRGYLGVQIQPVTPDMAAALGLKDAKGAMVADVVAGGPAAKAGFEQGDIVTAINGQAVEDHTDLTRKVALVAAGQTATFNVNRQGRAMQLRAVIAARPDEQRLASAAEPAAPQNTAANGTSAMGLNLVPLTPQVRRARNLDDDATGLVITKVDPNSDAADKGLQAGDVVLKINNRAVASAADLQAGIADAKKAGRKTVLLLVSSGSANRTGFVAVDIGA